MFPEITRDEVFRIETARFWLRWPTIADADAVAALLARDSHADIAVVCPAGLVPLIDRWRAENAAGAALCLAVTPKVASRRPVGLVRLRAVDASAVLDLKLPDTGLDDAKQIIGDLVQAAFLYCGRRTITVAEPASMLMADALDRIGFGPGDGRGEGSAVLLLDRVAWRRGRTLQEVSSACPLPYAGRFWTPACPA
jgi:hypothetical protein